MGTTKIRQQKTNLQGSVGGGAGFAALGGAVAAGDAWEGSSTIGVGANKSTDVVDVVVVVESISKPNKSTSGAGLGGLRCGTGALGGICGVAIDEGRVGACGGGGGGGGDPDIPPNNAAANLSFSTCSAVLTGATGCDAVAMLVPNPPYPDGAGAVVVLEKVETEGTFSAAG